MRKKIFDISTYYSTICYVEIVGVFVSNFETIFSANKFSSDPKKSYNNYLNFMTLIENKKI